MRQIIFFSLLILSFVLTGCPQQKQEPPQKTAPADKTGTVTKPAVKTEPSDDASKEAVQLVEKLGGSYELTKEGTVKSITLDSSELTADVFKLFAKQPDLETLLISNYRKLNEAMVSDLAGLKKLKRIKLTNSESFNDAAVKKIVENFPHLTDLDISSNTLLTDAALKEISKLKELKSLSMMYCNFGEFGIMDIASMPKLESLDIRANMQIGNSAMGCLAELPSLKKLKHMSQAVDDSGLEALLKSKGLQELEIQDFNITDRSGEFISKFEGLVTLIIHRCQGFGSQGLLNLKGMKLNRLTLRDLPTLDDSGMEVFRDLPALKRLYLRELNSLGDGGMLNLVSVKDLETLSIWEIPITDKAVETIAKLPNLKSLELRNTGISDASVDALLAMPKLEELIITDNPKVSPAGLKKLEDSKKFKKLDTKPFVPKR
ncbi:MAG: hypothetical protein LBN39_12940 [Planctomycetaceae bacterium]|jgi:Leucine-rich repeat (LRR) protein|nr:hypothetical protein [Planctomycetaceae bacterium]